ncbi:Lp6.6 family lipoprotein [Borreliella tanukii]|uniref:Lp6.6 family lipoprotein n=1 Tax=Borreliella tanukii TaxID=56146 RepID=UPI002648D5C4|nr:Lp6.6 family lipoprotein [Borreliella tanukii]WKC79421.1 Lp6.6 family lipoprotein [Borreliella tanukii]WKC80340.1 Lp6.6 family lipoprotein [Borreliella tanukii]WKC81253.1 Lp6.6 family lipoprotein [Borreliella tanukii]WKC82168.1 Lp6.6 family lipoprotein [Borreliella tanukii]
MTKLMYAMFLSAILFIACETTRISDEMENAIDENSKVTAPMPEKTMKSNKQPMKSNKK